jgi:hypothetical protein
MPLLARIALAAAVVALAGVVVATVSGALPRVVSSIGQTFSGFAETAFATASPDPTAAPIPDPPTLAAPASRDTRSEAVTIGGTIPVAYVGRDDYLVRVYVALPDMEPVPVRDVPVGATPSFQVVDLPLEKGRNDITATVVGPGGESEPSAIVTLVLDRTKPKVTITSPKDGARVNRSTLTIKGKTQARSVVVARNEANGTSASTDAEADGTFTLKVPLSAGTNGVSVTATDPAGNSGTAVISVRRGAGKLTVGLTASAYRLKQSSLPRTIELRAQVTDPDGASLGGVRVSFTLTLPGVPAITGEDVTGSDGQATFRTTIPAGASRGSGLATAFVETDEHGDASGRLSITIVK